MCTHEYPRGESLAKENPPPAFDNAEESAISPVRATASDFRENGEERTIVYLQGWRLYVLTVACDEQKSCRMKREAAYIFADYV